MPQYDIQDASGKIILTLEGDAPPTDADIDDALSVQAQTTQQAEQVLRDNPTSKANPLAFIAGLNAEQAAIPTVEERLAQAVKPNIQQKRFTDLPGMNERTSLLGVGTPEEARKKAINEFAQLDIGDEYVHPIAGRIRKSGSLEYQVIDPNERSKDFIANVGEAGKSAQRAAIKSAIALGAGMAGDRQVIEDIAPKIEGDIGEVGRTLGATEKVVVPAAIRMAGPVIGGLTAPVTGLGAVPIASSLSGLGEILAERYEGREKINPYEVGASVLTGPIGLNNLKTGTGLARSLLTGATEGLAVGGANTAARKLDDISEGREVSFGKEDLVNTGLTTVLGSLARGAEKGVNKGMEVLAKSKEAPPMASVATQNAANIGGDTNALQQSVNQVTTPPQQDNPLVAQAMQAAKAQDVSLQKLQLDEINEAIKNQKLAIEAEANEAALVQQQAERVRQSQAGQSQLREQLAEEEARAVQQTQLEQIRREILENEISPVYGPSEKLFQDDLVKKELDDIVLTQDLNKTIRGNQLAGDEASSPILADSPRGQLLSLDADKAVDISRRTKLSPQAQRMYDEYGRIDSGLLPILGSSAAGGIGGSAYGLTQGETPEERLQNALRYGGLGMVAAPALTAGVISGLNRLGGSRSKQFLGDIEPQMLDDVIPVERNAIQGQPIGLGDELIEVAHKQLPEDLDFLYQQTYKTKDGVEKTVNNFQVDKTPENPRGITLDDIGLIGRGYSQDQITRIAQDAIGRRGFAGSADTGAILNPKAAFEALQNRLRSPQKIAEQVNPPVDLPETDSRSFIREGVKKAIRNRDNPLELRQTLADDPNVKGVRHGMTELVDRMEQLDEAGLRGILASTEVGDFEKLGAQATLFNRLNAEGRFAEAAPLMAEATKTMTPSAQIINYGKLFKNPEAYAEGIVRELEEFNRTLSDSQYKDFTRLGQADISAEERLRQATQNYGQDINEATTKELKDAEQSLGQIKRELAEKTAAFIPKRTASLMAQRIKLGLLSIPTVTVGFAGNALNLAIKEGTQPVVAGIDALRSAVTGAPREVMNAQTLEAWTSSAKTFGRNFKELFTGASDTSYALGRGSVGGTPLKDIRQAFGSADNFPVKLKDGIAYVPNRDRAMRLLRGVTGLVSLEAPIQRLLILSDNPFREFRRVNLMEEQANIRGLTGDAKKQFIASPPPDVLRQVEKEAADTVFAEDNFLTQMTEKAIRAVPKKLRANAKQSDNPREKLFNNMAADAIELGLVTQVPFAKFPVNYVGKAMTLGVPGLALAQSAKSFAMGDIRAGEEYLRDAMLNAAGISAGVWLYNKGAVTAPPSTDPNRRKIDYAQIGAGKINISQIQRALRGEWKKGDSTYQEGDIIRDLSRIGPMAAPILLTAKYLDKKTLTPPQKVSKKDDGNVDTFMSYLSGVPSFMLEQSPLTGARSFLQALADSDDEDKLKSWLNNTTRALVSGALPSTLDKMANFQTYSSLLDTRPETANPLQMAKDIVAYKLQQIPKETAIERVDIWGRAIDVNKDINPFVKQFIDPFRTEKVVSDPWEIELAKIYRDSRGNPDVYPSIPNREITVDNMSFTVDKQDAAILAKERGERYAKGVRAMLEIPQFNDLTPNNKALVLSDMYRKINSEHLKEIKNSQAVFDKYGDKIESKSTKRLAIEEARQQ